MNILTSVPRIPAQPKPRLEVENTKPVESSAFTPAEPKDGWVSAACSLAGGATALVGALSGRPLLAAGGSLLTAVATGFTAHRVQDQGMDQAAWVSLAGAGLMAASAAVILSGPPSPPIHPGPLPQLIDKFGFHGL